ncbi:bifunctional diguanylate cyclase/phosphodiesterase [Chitiniphilus eburneus]|uniref:EAL domain-containing protein n=1 Tax=Chitiniphilus eburneus TaxID=2571148 RepID=A0A4U0QCU9_9NEIS|nr:EAL domain-containing protein [Chitiniphilus eburneus]TJZ78970.1 EAL domain-containing protein [Chitiniphilus eburneus]
MSPPPAREQDDGHSFARIRVLLVVLSVVVMLFTLGALGWSSLRSYQETQNKAELYLLTLARTTEEHVGRTMESSVNALFSIQQDTLFRKCLAARDDECLYAYLQRVAVRYPQLGSLAVIYEDGRLAATTRTYPTPNANLANERYYRTIRALPGTPHYIAEPGLDPGGGGEIIPIATGLSGAGGAFAGVLMAGLSPGYFADFYRSLETQRGTTLRVFRDDGATLLFYPESARERVRNIGARQFFDEAFLRQEAGVFHETDDAPGGRRLYGWRHVSGWPLGVAVGSDRSVVLATWQRENLINLGITCLMLLASGSLLIYVLQQLKRLEQTEADLYLTKVAVERGADMAVWLDDGGVIRYVNATACNRLGYSEGELLSMRLKDVNPGFKPESWPRFWMRLREHKHLFDEVTFKTRTGEEFPIEVYSNFIVFKGREYNCAVVRDISERRMAEEAIVKSEQQLRLALEASNTGLFDMPLESRRTAVTSPEYDRLLGYEPGELIETFEKWKSQLHPSDRENVMRAVRDYYTGAAHQLVIEYRRKRKDGEFHWYQTRGRFIDFDEQQRPNRLIGTVTDITERKEAQDRITELANFDTVTGLANRNLLRDELKLSVAAAERYHRRLAVLFLDLDRFKTINDSLGHAAGDQVLMQVAERLRGIVGRTDILARLGGDEFVVVLSEIQDAMQAGQIAERILESFSEPFELEAGGFASSTSIGIALYPDDGDDSETLIRNADVAMYQAKANGRNNYQYFTADLNVLASERLVLETSMRQALVNNEFTLFYQPQAGLADGGVIGAEALIRWRHPEHGLIPPGKFIPVAEESRLIVPIGNWVLREACRQAAEWQAAGLPPLTIAVNLSPLQLHQANLLEIVADALAASGLDAQYLELEVTESVVMQEVEHVMAMLHGLKRLGVKLSIDDFGTGYSSLSYLKRFAFDKLKVDQSFVRDLTTDPNDAAIVLAIIGLGKTLGMSVLAEGVETAEQLAFLQSADIDAIQGFFFSRPIPAEEFRQLMERMPVLPLPEMPA